MIDRLITANLKMYHQEDIKRNPNATDSEIADATRKTNKLNAERNDLIDALDLAYNEIAEGKKQKLYGSNKSYGK